jgi:DNA-binding MarR family transcriptional regulator
MKNIREKNKVMLNMIQTSNLLLKEADNFFKKYNVTAAQYNALVVIEQNSGKITQKLLGKHLVVTKGNITGLIDQLEKKKYMIRVSDKHDRRNHVLEILKKGKELINKVEQEYFKHLKKILKDMKETDIKRLMMITENIKNKLL